MGQNAGNFNLSFQQVLGTNQLVRKGGRDDPLKRQLRAVRVDQYGNLMAYPNPNDRLPKVWDFRLDLQGMIDPQWSSGLSTFTDKGSLPEELQKKEDQLWKLVKVINGETLMYPIEVIIRRDGRKKNHFVIKPGVPVRLEIFRQMLRCLPWLKMYEECEEARKIDEESKNNKTQVVQEEQIHV